jgi:hypothetical protein
MMDGRVRHLGYFDDEITAALMYARASYKYKQYMENHVFAGMDVSHVPTDLPLLMEDNNSGTTTTQYMGVTQNNETNRWEARITLPTDGTMKYLGSFDTPEQAAQVYTRVSYALQHPRSTTTNSTEEESSAPPPPSNTTTTAV